MSTGKLKNMKFTVSHFWGEKLPTNNSEDRTPIMLGQAIAMDDEQTRQWTLWEACLNWKAMVK